MHKLFQRQQQHLDFFFEKIDHEQAEQFLQFCLKGRGLLVFTGVGKSGIVAEKIAMTLISTGTRALHLPVTNFLHGDIGVLTSDDIVIFLTKSGETEELLELVPYIRRKGARLAAIVSNPVSRLARVADCTVYLPVEKELCPFDLAPTTSTAVQLVFGDALAIAMMEARGFSLADYAVNHPAGAIGKKTTLKVEDLMFKVEQIPLARADQKLGDVLAELSEKRLGCLLIANSQLEFKGIFTDGDLKRALQTHGDQVLNVPMAELMTSSATTISKDVLAWDALKIMQRDPKRLINTLPVLQNQQVIGLLRMHDIVQAGIT